jgi:hypothetical protein
VWRGRTAARPRGHDVSPAANRKEPLHMRTPTARKSSLTRRGGFVVAAFAAVSMMGGNAFTAGNTMTAADTVVGYGETVITGATVTSLSYTLSGDGSDIDSATLVLSGDTTGSSVEIGFNDGTTSSCGAGSFSTDTTYTCNDGANFGVNNTTSDLVKTSVAVS